VPLFLTEADVTKILTMPLAMECVETSFRRLADNLAASRPRQRLRLGEKGLLHYMAATDAAGGYAGLKIYTVVNGRARFVVPLFRAESGDMVALMEADYLGQMRTGAATGVATRVMAREDARIASIIGTGLQARTQLEAVSCGHKLDRVRAFGRDRERREKFAKEMTARLGIPVEPASSAEEAVRGSDIVITITNSVTPVLEGRWLEPGMHVNAAGVNFAHRREVDSETVSRADVIAADSVEDAKIESGDLIQAFGSDAARWNDVREFADVITGKIPGRTSREQITLFKSNGIAMEDVVAGARVYELARERGIGREIPIWG
jgi:ornithine cyclodeaminase/alanine dehydrogenase-like protein (mu-crystallin family)